MNKGKIIEGPSLERAITSSLGQVFFNIMQLYEDNVCLVDPTTNREITAKILLRKAAHLAKWFWEKGIGPGHFVGISSENTIEYPVVLLATLFSGATYTSFNPDYTPVELNEIIDLTKPSIIFCSERSRKNILNLKSKRPYIRYVVLFGRRLNGGPKLRMYNDILKGAGETSLNNFAPSDVNPEKNLALVLYSSGTTGLPKGVMLTHANLTAFLDMTRESTAKIMATNLLSDTAICVVPLFHAMGLISIIVQLLGGRKIIVLPKFNLKLFLGQIVKYKVKFITMPPPLWHIFSKHPLVKKYDLSHMTVVGGGGAVITKEMEDSIHQKLPTLAYTVQAYGMTESVLGLTFSPLDITKRGSVGKLLPGVKCKVINEKNEILGPYEVGELCFSAPSIAIGYINNPKATAETFCEDGYLHTGDLGYYDNDEFFYIVDRKKELIKYKSYQVPPAELENLLTQYPGIADAGVVGLPDEAAGELPLAFVVKTPNAKITAAEIEKYISDNVSPPKRLRGGVIFVDAIPHTETGKILRKELRKKAIKLKSKL